MPPQSDVKQSTTRKSTKFVPHDADDEIVITGISGTFPKSSNVREFSENLLAKKNMISKTDIKYKSGNKYFDYYYGKLGASTAKFDAEFFKIENDNANKVSPMVRMFLEKTFEAILDAGYNPEHFKGSKTGVFVAMYTNECGQSWIFENQTANSLGLISNMRFSIPNFTSNFFGFQGPSLSLDSACTSSISALENAFVSIKNGICDSAIVGSCNLCSNDGLIRRFHDVGVGSTSGKCSCFDETADGFVRAECIAAIFLQKAKDARRVYANVVHVKTNANGRHRTPVITEPSTESQTDLFQKFYEECGVDPISVDFVEAHATGTKEGDLREALAIESVFCPGRNEPLKIGSIKSNMGHGEGASGLCSIAKIIVGFELGIIPPNINFKTPRADIEAFRKGRMTVVTEPTPWTPLPLAAVSNYGLGGVNGHVLLRWNSKGKLNKEAHDDLPRLVVASGRDEQAVDIILKDFENRALDVEYVHLFHQIHVSDISGHGYRGYTLVEKNKQTRIRSIESLPNEKRPLWFVFSGEGTQWPAMGRSLMALPLFRESIYKCHQILQSKNINLTEILTDENRKSADLCVGITAIQIALYDILTKIGIQPDGFVGYSVGEVACAYADGCFTLEEAILTSYYRNKALTEAKLVHGALASVDLGRDELNGLLPPDIDIACFNGPNNCTISGPSQIIKDFIKVLRENKVHVEELDGFGIPYHSRYIVESIESFRTYMKQAIPHQRLRSKKWICTSNPEAKWNNDDVKYAGAQFYANNLLNSVYFEEAIRHVPANAIVIELAPGLLQKILAKALGKRAIHIPLMAENETQNLQFFLHAVGRMFAAGLNPILHKLYPPVSLPVARGTPMISPLVKWRHNKDWFVTSFFANLRKSRERSALVSLANPTMQYLSGHVIDGRNLYPAAGYLMIVWEEFASMQDRIFLDISVVFENVKFVRATVIPEDEIEFKILLHRTTGYFEMMERDATVATGYIRELANAGESLETNDAEPVAKLPLNSDDIYKEFRLRGYNYQGIFQGITASDYDGTRGRIKWEENFVSFLDNIFQMSLFDTDWRTLFVPTGLRKLTINTKDHFKAVRGRETEKIPEINVYADKKMKSIKCGGIEIQHLNFTNIARRKDQNEQNIEKIVFIPFVNQWSGNFWEAMRLCADIVFRNAASVNLKVLQYVNDFTSTDRNLICVTFTQICQKFPLIQTSTAVQFNKSDHPLRKKNLLPGMEVYEGDLPKDESKTVFIVENILKQKHMLPTYLKCIEENGFLLSIENADDNVSFKDINICANHVVEDERFLLLRKLSTKPTVEKTEPIVVKITEGIFSWVPTIQNYLKILKTDDKSKLILYSENEKYSGVLGLAQCLKMEVGIAKIRCVLIMDASAPPFSINHPFYKSQLSNELTNQVYKNGKWGTYVNVPLEMNSIMVPYATANTLTVGDLSSLRWLESPLNPITFRQRKDTALVYVHYSALNFRDIMLATGKIPHNAVVKSRLEEEFVQGMEYSGKTTDGKRVMGIVSAKAMATLAEVDVNFMLPVPDNWTLEEAATVPVVYATVLYALLFRGRLKRGCSVLIHAGSGGVGQAAIHVCQYYDCTIFTTVGTQEKRNFIKMTFPNIPDNHIGNSRDTSFERMIKKETNGRGVDVVLNSLAEEKLQASVNCLAHGGQFLEIGLYDLVMNNPLGMEHFLKEITFHGIELANLFYADTQQKRKLRNVLLEFVDKGCIRPLTRTVFSTDELQAAFRYMATGKHIGKVLLRMKDETVVSSDRSTAAFINAVPRYSCSEDKSYVVCGGLGGIGLELIDWLVIRGARKLVISSRNGVVSGYQNWRLHLWRSYGAVIVICTEDVTQEEGVETLLKTAAGLGPVSAIFNLAAVLHDSLFDNHTEESFAASFGPKALGTLHLDRASRKLCLNLERFVVFSSVTANYGNTGQTNYGMSNSIMERICEQRKSENLPALAIQIGPIADVGLMSANYVKGQILGGLRVEPVSTILENLDWFLKQQNPVVLCATVVQKQASSDKKKSLLDVITEITGIKNLKNINKNATLLDYGMDSMMIVELAQTCQREFDLFFTPQDLKVLTLGKLLELHESMTQGKGATNSNSQQEIQPQFEEVEVSQFDLEFTNLVKSLDDTKEKKSSTIQLPSSMNKELRGNFEGPTTPIFFLPGLDGNVKLMECLSAKLNARIVGMAYGYDNLSESIQECAARMAKVLTNEFDAVEEFCIVGYSYGALVALEMVKILESVGKTGLLYLIDPIPDYAATIRKKFAVSGEKIWEDIKKQLVAIVLQNFWTEYPKTLITQVEGIDDWSSVVNTVVSALPPKYENHKERLKMCLDVSYFRLKRIIEYEIVPPEIPVRSLTTLVNPAKNEFTSTEENWSQCFSLPISIRQIECDPFEILNQAETAEIIMEELSW